MTCPVTYEVEKVCRSTSARVGLLRLARGDVPTPTFMPVGTQAAVRSLPARALPETGSHVVLANTYHLHQRPGEGLIDKLGGLHKFMGVQMPILTDSGGFQVFSLQKKTVTEDGVEFAYEIDGRRTFLSPETSMAIQQLLGADIAMAFDECLHPEADKQETIDSVDLTARWAERSLAAHDRPDQSLFGIVQGGMIPSERARSARQITSMGFDGFAIGGLSVGEGPEVMNRVLSRTTPVMPADKVRYLMGVGRPQDIVDGVAAGVDMFDCVIPTRHARSGTVYTFQGRMRVTHSRYKRDGYPLDTSCRCYTCTTFSRAYLNHLFAVGEVLGATLCTLHNLTFFAELTARIRAAIRHGKFAELRREIKELYPEKGAAWSRAPEVPTAQGSTSARGGRAVAGGRSGQRPPAAGKGRGKGKGPPRGPTAKSKGSRGKR